MFPFSHSRGGGAAVVAPGVGTTWSQTNKAGSWSLSADQLTATHDASSSYNDVRATASKNSSAAFTATRQSGSSSSAFIGIGKESNALGDSSVGAYIGLSNGLIYVNNDGGSGRSPTGAISNGAPVLVELGSDGTTVTFSVSGTVRGSVTLPVNAYLPQVFANGPDSYLANFNPSGKPAWG